MRFEKYQGARRIARGLLQNRNLPDQQRRAVGPALSRFSEPCGASHWGVLPADVRRRAAADLVAARFSDRKRDILRAALSEKTEKVRQDIRASLQAEGISEVRLAAIAL